MRERRYRFLVLCLAVTGAVTWLWAHRARPPEAPPTGEGVVPAPEPPAPPDKTALAPRPALYVLAINGGGSARENYLSHLQHLQGLVDLLHVAGVPADRITVLAGDGSDPAPDLVVREQNTGAEFWRLRGTVGEEKFSSPYLMGNSQVSGATLYPATRGSLSIWMLTVGQQLRPGDTLLLYVTDHGTMGTVPEDNRIVLWESGQGLSVRELRGALETLGPAVRVVALMSQCYSGGFATLLSLGGAAGEPTGRFCGYFAAKDKGKSYGCYPETRTDPKVGHSFAFLQALPATAGGFALAHDLVAERDDTPDVPMRTSDLHLRQLLEKAAGDRKLPVPELVDELLRSAWAQPGSFAHQAQLLDGLATRFGVGRMRSQAQVDEASTRLRQWSSRLDDAAKVLGRTLEGLNRAAFRRFSSARPEWQASLKPANLDAMDGEQRLRLGARLVAELTGFARSDPEAMAQDAAREIWDAEGKLAFRTKVRIAALERMTLVLDQVAALQYLEGMPQERKTVQKLFDCEALALPVPKTEWVAPAPLPPLDDDLAQAEMILALTATEGRGKPSLPRLREPAPELTLVPYRGEAPAVGTGSSLLLFFWATWCKPCKAIVPEVMALAERRKLTVLAISLDTESDLNRFFAAPRDFPALVSRDPEARLSTLLGVRAVPSFVLIDGQGKVASKVTNYLRELPEQGEE